MPLADSYAVYVDWNNDGDFSDSYEDITAYVRRMNWSIGRDYASQLLGRSLAGSFRADLKNPDGLFSRFNTSSPLFGDILPGRPVKVTMTVGGVTTTMFRGFLETVDPQVMEPTGHGASAILSGIGPLGYLVRKKVYSEMKTSILTGDAITEILDLAGWSASLRSIDTGKTTMNRWWAAGEDAVSAMRGIEETELGFIRETKDGKIAWEDRHHRLISPHTVSQATYSDAPGADIPFFPPTQPDPLKQIYNIIEATVQTYTVGNVSILWTLSETGSSSPVLAPGTSRIFRAVYNDGVNAWVTPVTVTDFTANRNADGSGADMTSFITVSVTKLGTVMDIELTNTSATSVAYITHLQARGTPLVADSPVMITDSDATSKAAYGERTYPSPALWLPSTQEARSYCQAVKVVYADPIPVLILTISANRNASTLEEAMLRDISDRVSVEANGACGLGIDADFFVERMSHQVDPGKSHQVTLELSPVSGGYSGQVWIIGTSELNHNAIIGY